MESSILLTIKARLKNELNLPNELIDSFINLLEDYEIGDYLYYEYFRTQIGITDEEFILLTNILVRMGIVEKVYKILCPTCGEISKTVYHKLNEIRDTDVCEKCGCDLVGIDESFKYILVFFRLVSYGQ